MSQLAIKWYLLSVFKDLIYIFEFIDFPGLVEFIDFPGLVEFIDFLV